MTPAEYRTHRRRTTNHSRTFEDQLLNVALGLGEVGELQNIIKKHIFHGHPLDSGAVMDEAGDILFYLDWLFEIMGGSFAEAFELNREKLAARYPEGFDPAKSLNREI